MLTAHASADSRLWNVNDTAGIFISGSVQRHNVAQGRSAGSKQEAGPGFALNTPARGIKSMILKVRINSERAESFTGKKGLVNQVMLTCQDIDPSGVRLANTFDYALSDEEKQKYAGKLLDREAFIGIHDLLPFGGRLRARGKITEVPSLDGKSAAK